MKRHLPIEIRETSVVNAKSDDNEKKDANVTNVVNVKIRVHQKLKRATMVALTMVLRKRMAATQETQATQTARTTAMVPAITMESDLDSTSLAGDSPTDPTGSSSEVVDATTTMVSAT